MAKSFDEKLKEIEQKYGAKKPAEKKEKGGRKHKTLMESLLKRNKNLKDT